MHKYKNILKTGIDDKNKFGCLMIFFIQSLKNRAAKPIEIFLHGVLFSYLGSLGQFIS